MAMSGAAVVAAGIEQHAPDGAVAQRLLSLAQAPGVRD